MDVSEVVNNVQVKKEISHIIISRLHNHILHIVLLEYVVWDPSITNSLSPFVSLLKRITPSFTIISRNTTLISRSTINLCFVMWLTTPWPFFNEIKFFSREETTNQNQHDQLQFTPNKGFHIISYNFIFWWHTKDIWYVPHITICTWEVAIKSRPTTLIDHVALKFSLT